MRARRRIKIDYALEWDKRNEFVGVMFIAGREYRRLVTNYDDIERTFRNWTRRGKKINIIWFESEELGKIKKRSWANARRNELKLYKKNTTPYAIREIYEQRTALVSSATLNSAKYSIGWAIQRLCQNNGIIGACSLAFWHYMHNTSGVYVHL